MRSNDGTPWTWRRAAPRYLLLLVASVLAFHSGFGLGWLGTTIAVLCGFGGGFLVWFAAWRLSKRRPTVVPADSVRARVLLWAVRRGYGRRGPR
jgi:hypothetical protein